LRRKRSNHLLRPIQESLCGQTPHFPPTPYLRHDLKTKRGELLLSPQVWDDRTATLCVAFE